MKACRRDCLQIGEHTVGNGFDGGFGSRPILGGRGSDAEVLVDLQREQGQIIGVDEEVLDDVRGARDLVPVDEPDRPHEDVDHRLDDLIPGGKLQVSAASIPLGGLGCRTWRRRYG